MNKLPEKELLRPDEVADYFSMSVKTIYNWIDKGKIEAVRVGESKILRIKREFVKKMTQMDRAGKP